jgi:hypothetical protein
VMSSKPPASDEEPLRGRSVYKVPGAGPLVKQHLRAEGKGAPEGHRRGTLDADPEYGVAPDQWFGDGSEDPRAVDRYPREVA